MEFSIKFDTIKSVTLGSLVIIFKKCYNSLQIDFVLANSADPDEMHLIWVFTVCQSNHLGVSGLQSFN